MTVGGSGTFFAEGVLVSNCDAMQYASLHIDSTFGAVVKAGRREVKVANAMGWT